MNSVKSGAMFVKLFYFTKEFSTRQVKWNQILYVIYWSDEDSLRKLTKSCTPQNLTKLAKTKHNHWLISVSIPFLKMAIKSWVFHKRSQVLQLGWRVCISRMSTSCISIIRLAPGLGHHHAMPRLAFLGIAQRDMCWLRAERMRRREGESGRETRT